MEVELDMLSKENIIEALIHNTPIAYIVLDDQYRIHFLNDSFLKLRNLDKESTLGEICYNISNKGVPCDKCAVRVGLESKQSELVCRKDILPNGTVRYLDDYAIPLTLKEESAESSHSYVLEIMIDRSSVMLERAKRNEMLSGILETLIEMLESKDGYTALHSKNVYRYARLLAQAMGLDDKEVNEIAIAGLLHDIGKVDIPHSIINKPGKLNDEEYTIMKDHPIFGDEMLEGFMQFARIKDHVRHHHERTDGKGYPDSLASDSISRGSKILAIADAYDAMTTDRSYRKALPHDVAIQELIREKGAQFDPNLVDCFVQLDLSKATSSQENSAETNEVVRNLSTPSAKTENLEEVRQSLVYKSDIDESEFLKAIFENTPCGYVLTDPDGTVLFASDYYLNYQGLDAENFLGASFDDELIDQTRTSKETHRELRETTVEGEERIYELFSIPVMDDEEVEYLVLCTIDRTEEIQLARSFDQDFMKVIELVQSLITRRFGDEAAQMMEKGSLFIDGLKV